MTGYEAVPLRDFLKVRHGKSQREVETRTGRYPILGTGGEIGRTDTALFNRPSVLIGRKGTIDKPRYLDTPFWTVDTLFYTEIDTTRADPKFVYYQFLEIPWASFNEASGVPSLSSRRIEEVKIPLPDLEMQRRIVKVLSKADECISSLERLISKKQAIKQGMMQELLTGKTRLPGFSDEWNQTTVGSLGQIFKGRGVKRDDVKPEGVPCIRYGELYTTYRDFTNETVSFVDDEVAAASQPIRTGDLLFAGSGETKAEIGTCVAYVGNAPAVAGGDIIVLRTEDTNAIFLASLLNTPELAAKKASSGQGDAVVHISARAIAKLDLVMPEKAEQDAIAQVITVADSGVKALQRSLDSMLLIKKGMMQELLTGRTRLTTVGV